MYSLNSRKPGARDLRRLLAGHAGLAVVLLASPVSAAAEPGPNEPLVTVADDDQRDVVVVTGEKPVQQQNPTTVESVTAEQIAITTAVTNAEDALRYLPNIVVRKRHVGDTFAPIIKPASAPAVVKSFVCIVTLLVS